jgi:hypothetical protein
MQRLAPLMVLALGCGTSSTPPGDHDDVGGVRGWVAPSGTLGALVEQPPIPDCEPARPRALIDDAPAVRRFRDAHPGSWDIDLDPVLGTARAIAGEGIPATPADVDALLAAHRDLFGLEDAAPPESVTSADGRLVAITYLQRHRGVPIVGAHLGVTLVDGRIALIQGTTYRVPPALEVAPRTSLRAAIAIADNRLVRADELDRADGRLVIVPERMIGRHHDPAAFRLAWEVTAWRGARRVHAYVDATSNDFVAAHDANLYDYAGTATNRVDERTVGDTVLTIPASDLRLQTVRGGITTDATGAFAVRGFSIGPMAVTANLRGTFVDVKNVSGPSATFVGMLWPDRPNGLAWNEARSLPEERDVFRAVNTTSRYVGTVFKDVPWMNTPVPANVNLRSTCNAFWNGLSINFYREGGPCNNTGRIFDVVAHEWGHGLDDNMPGGILDGALSEFIGDLLGFLQTDSPLIGPGFFKTGGEVRDLEDPAYRCFDPKKREVHDAGQLLGTVVWDVYKDLKAAGVTGEHLKRLLVLPIAIAQQRAHWYRAMLAADDTDGNLANGTPHECLIYRQFVAHSCKGTRWPGLPDRDPPGCAL